MSVDPEIIRYFLPQIGTDLQRVFSEEGTLMEVPAGKEIMKEGQSVKMIPIVLEGLVKVFTRYEDKELLLYYIEPSESCVMSFLAGIKNLPSKIFAHTETDTKLLLLPSSSVEIWTRHYPQLNYLFYDLYNTRYTELIDTLNQLIFQKLDSRIYEHLRDKSRITGNTILNLRHREIANALGTSREVITRVLKKLEKEGKVRQTPAGIELL
ncbi:MAG: Crp/Fnr family transcriptional regulator [Cyclobacteriaceae bacterium]|jgi:CRP/FNR family transcriptional regulator|nr:Crp/Fnr family transcriptional regulator [Cyclobacteriaceae bacterium]